jgi:hypothetical protein
VQGRLRLIKRKQVQHAAAGLQKDPIEHVTTVSSRPPSTVMQAIRKRNPFTLQSEDHDNGRTVIDDQGNRENELMHMCSPSHRAGRGGGSNQGTERVVEQAESSRFTTHARTVMSTVRRFQSY